MLAFLSTPATRTLFVLVAVGLVTAGLLYHYYHRRTQLQGKPMAWRKVWLYLSLFGFVLLCVMSEPLFRAVVYLAFGVSERAEGANASSAQVAADHVIGGWVQIGTLLSKLFAAISFYITGYTLPWLLQRATHPVLTTWAKEDYDADFKALTPAERFGVYRGLQLNQSIRYAASLLAAALLV